MVFRGRFEHCIDEKSRLAVPARFRDVLGEDALSAPLIVTNLDHCLCVYPLKEWEKVEASFMNLPQFDPNVLAFQRYFLASAAECSIDKAGRITLPQSLREFAKIQRDCVINGNLTKFEIWAKEQWDSVFKGYGARFDQMAAAINSLGIRI